VIALTVGRALLVEEHRIVRADEERQSWIPKAAVGNEPWWKTRLRLVENGRSIIFADQSTPRVKVESERADPWKTPGRRPGLWRRVQCSGGLPSLPSAALLAALRASHAAALRPLAQPFPTGQLDFHLDTRQGGSSNQSMMDRPFSAIA